MLFYFICEHVFSDYSLRYAHQKTRENVGDHQGECERQSQAECSQEGNSDRHFQRQTSPHGPPGENTGIRGNA